MENILEAKIPIDITDTSAVLDGLDCEEWQIGVNCVPKLQTYFSFKKWISC